MASPFGPCDYLGMTTGRFHVRPDRDGFSVYDARTGEPAVIGMTPQTGLSREDADHTADLLNRRPDAALPQ